MSKQPIYYLSSDGVINTVLLVNFSVVLRLGILFGIVSLLHENLQLAMKFRIFSLRFIPAIGTFMKSVMNDDTFTGFSFHSPTPDEATRRPRSCAFSEPSDHLSFAQCRGAYSIALATSTRCFRLYHLEDFSQVPTTWFRNLKIKIF